MKLSIIIPVYNAQERLQLCVESVLKQTFRDFELILINDGSKDDSLAICRKLAEADGRIRVIDQENRGAGEARNTGIDAAKGEFILFVDADDTIAPDMAERLIALMKEKVDLVCCAHVEQTEGQAEKRTKTYRIPDDPWVTEDLAACFLEMDRGGHFCYLWNKLFRKSMIDENGSRFHKRFVTGEDLDFMLQYYEHVRCCAVTNYAPYFYYSNGTDSLCARYKKDLYEMVAELSEERMQMYRHFGLLETEEGRKAYERSHLIYLHSCIPNMFRKNARLSRKEKKRLFQQLFDDRKLQEYMPRFEPSGRIERIYQRTFLKGNAASAARTYSLLFAVRNRADGLYRKLRGGEKHSPNESDNA